ncbi:hemin-degrading factor [Pseudooceanicola sp. 502str34]
MQDLSSPSAVLSPEAIRAARKAHDKLRIRDLAHQLKITEGQLVAAFTGHGVTRISADPDQLVPRVAELGEVMALTRTESCVHEKIGHYDHYRGGQHASMVLNGEIDLRIFPKFWVHAFAVTPEAGLGGGRPALMIFDAAGDAVHKIYSREGSDVAAFARIAADLALPEQSEEMTVEARRAPEAPKSDPEKAEKLREFWNNMTDSHQFLGLVSKLKMNRLGAYRVAGAPLARPLSPRIVPDLFERVAEAQVPVMIFVGNKGCIQIHSGPLNTIKPMGPWLNVLDPTFNLHLRADHVAEVWLVEKPTRRGMAISVEAFDAEGTVIFQMFGLRKPDADHYPAWEALLADLTTETAEA